MTNEQLRMQMLSGVITESEYKAKLEEIGMFHDPVGYKKPELSDVDKMFTKEYKGNGVYVIYKNGKKIKTIEGEGNANAFINQEKRKLQEKDSLNEHYVAGGIVGIGAINNPFENRVKESYEDAFDHFLNSKYGLTESEDDMPKAPSHEETDVNQVYEEEVNEARISPDNAVAYLENTLGHVWNMGTGKNDIDLQSLAQSIAQDLGLTSDLDEGNDDLFTAKRFYKRTDNPRINILANLRAIDDIVMDMLETDLVKGYGPDERDDIYREYMKFVNAIQNLVK